MTVGKIMAWAIGLAAVSAAIGQPIVVCVNPMRSSNVTRDDIAQLRRLAAGVGWEFEPNEQTNEGLRKIGIKWIRCINVDPVPGKFNEKKEFVIDAHPTGPSYIDRLHSHFATCRAIGASPHIIIATGLHPDLVLQAKDVKTRDKSILGMVHSTTFGPTDWVKFRNYCKAVFRYVTIEQKFPDACFEVANEPDTGGVVVERPPKPGMGSKGLYEAYLKLYKNVALAARQFEQENKGAHVTLGGPATTWAYTFKFGDFNWMERFLRDVRLGKIKLDFIGLHYYGNLSPIRGPSTYSAYPSFSDMFAKTRIWRDKYMPGVPICFTEWGPTYNTSLDEKSVHNGNHVGAAWAAAFLNQMLSEGVDRALYLVTTDLRQAVKGEWRNVWGWPSLFTNNQVLGTHPKAPYHVFQMVRRMAPKRVEASDPGGTLGCIASRDDRGRLTVMLWNNSYQIRESDPGSEKGKDEQVNIRIAGANGYFKGAVHVRRYLVSKTVSNAYHLFEKGEKIDSRADLQMVEDRTLTQAGEALNIGFVQPPSSVSFLEMQTATVGNQALSLIPPTD